MCCICVGGREREEIAEGGRQERVVEDGGKVGGEGRGGDEKLFFNNISDLLWGRCLSSVMSFSSCSSGS